MIWLPWGWEERCDVEKKLRGMVFSECISQQLDIKKETRFHLPPRDRGCVDRGFRGRGECHLHPS